MGEVLVWTMAVFAILGLPPLIAVLWDLRRERKAAEQHEWQRRFEEEPTVPPLALIPAKRPESCWNASVSRRGRSGLTPAPAPPENRSIS